MSSCQLTAAVTAFANIIAAKLTTEEISLLGSIFTQLGDTLTTISTYQGISEDRKTETK